MFLKTNKAVEILQKEGVVAIPSETVYGLGAKANSQKAVNRVYEVKKRPKDNPLICHFYSLDQILEFTCDQPFYFSRLVDFFSPGPVSYLLKLKTDSELKIATTGLDTVICRIPNHPIFLEILKKLDYPIAAPSANLSTKYSSTDSQMLADLESQIDGIVDGGKSTFGLESTILNCLNQDTIEILRPGVVGVQELENFLKKENLSSIKIINKAKTTTVVPGNKYKHYSPNTPIFRVAKEILETADFSQTVFLGNSSSIKELKNKYPQARFLDLGNTSSQIAKDLFFNFYRLDQLKVQKAYLLDLDLDPEQSVDLAIANRLDKALG